MEYMWPENGKVTNRARMDGHGRGQEDEQGRKINHNKVCMKRHKGAYDYVR